MSEMRTFVLALCALVTAVPCAAVVRADAGEVNVVPANGGTCLTDASQIARQVFGIGSGPRVMHLPR
jgi:hypothetical protein